MSKAVEGAVMLAGAIGMGVGAFLDPALVASPLYDKAMFALAMGGLSMEMGAIAGALSQNRGVDVTSRQSAAFRQIIFGTQRVGGVEIYRNTTGSSRAQFNYVIVVDTHVSFAIQDLFLDGRLVHWNVGSVGNSTQNGINFGGSADGGTYTGPNGQQYNFGGKVYCQAYLGNQTNQPNTQPNGGFDTGLQANDPIWSPSAAGIPYVGGCTYVYLKIEYDQALFPGEPEIRFTVLGKPVFDPRTGQTTYSSNPALIVNDILTDPIWGLGDPNVNQAQLIAAANVCDERVPLAAGGTEARYAAHWHYDTSTAPGDVLATLMTSMAGRLSFIGGEWYIWPDYYQGPSASFDESSLTAKPIWNPERSYKELCNRIIGTYSPPVFPYNISGNEYDANGFYDGQIQNNFGFAFQPTNYPQYACDVAHGYAADQYLLEDGRPLPMEYAQPCTLSLSQAQRVAKIILMRNRSQGSGTLQLHLEGYQLQPADTFQMSFAKNGWENKLLEVNSTHFEVSADAGGAPLITFMVGVNETSLENHEWSVSEEQTIQDKPVLPASYLYIPQPPTNVVVISSAATALVAADGSVIARVQVNWNTPEDPFATSIQLQYRLSGTTAWLDGGQVDVTNNLAFLGPIVSGLSYDVRIRSLRPSGAASVWSEIDGTAASLVLAVGMQTGIAPNSLIAVAYSDGTAGIECDPFTAPIGNNPAVSYFPAGAVTLNALSQQLMYYVYVVDNTYSGGNLTPVATLDKADYLGKLGYLLIGTVVTPYASSGAPGSPGTPTGSGGRYAPNTPADSGDRATVSPTAAYDGDLSTYALISASATSSASTTGVCTFSGWAAQTLTAAGTLVVTMGSTIVGTGEVDVTMWIGSTQTAVTSLTSTTGQASYSCAVPSGTNLSAVSVQVSASAEYEDGPGGNAQPVGSPGNPTSGTTGSARALIYELYIST